MDSSSEDSFAWADASSDTTDNESMAQTKLSTTQSGEESESEKIYKKNLQQDLLSEAEDEESRPEAQASKLSRKRKHSAKRLDPDDDPSQEKKGVKIEPESDAETFKKKKKKSHRSVSQDSSRDLYDESFLESKVKNECYFAVPSPVKAKKHKKKRMSSTDEMSITNGKEDNPSEQQSFSEQSDKLPATTDSSPSHIEEEIDAVTPKKKKKKSRKKSLNSETKEEVKADIEENSFHVEDHSVEEVYNGSDVSVVSDGSSAAASERTARRLLSRAQRAPPSDHDSLNGTSSSKSVSERRLTMSERIQFEDNDSDVPVNTKSSDNIKPKLRKYLQSCSYLKPVQLKVPSALALTEDDEVWLLRCPTEVNIQSFLNKKFNLDSKLKIKLDGQTYEGEVGHAESDTIVVCAETDRAVVKKVAINGCIRLRRRLPKPQVQENNIMINNQTNFIPLPDTKCRHPLFGANYRKAINLPSAVSERLRAASPPPHASCSAKRKRERPTGTAQPEELTQPVVTTKKKKKKRKHSETNDTEEAPALPALPAPPRAKRPKRDLESAEAWDSEKAIEENLFNV